MTSPTGEESRSSLVRINDPEPLNWLGQVAVLGPVILPERRSTLEVWVSVDYIDGRLEFRRWSQLEVGAIRENRVWFSVPPEHIRTIATVL